MHSVLRNGDLMSFGAIPWNGEGSSHRLWPISTPLSSLIAISLGFVFRDLSHNPPPKPLIETEYVLGREVGRGGSGIVMHALQKKNGESCAIKIIDNRGRKEQQSEAVAREVSIMRRLQHSNICKMLDVFWEPSRTCENDT